MGNSSHMKYDLDKMDRAALAMLFLSWDSRTNRCWKSLDWEITDRLFEAGLISDPKSKNKSVFLTEAGLKKAKKAFIEDFEGTI